MMGNRHVASCGLLCAMLGWAWLAGPPAQAIYNEASEAAPVADVDFDHGVKAVKSGHWRDAADALERAAKKHAHSAEVFSLLGFAYRKLGEFKQSFANYYKALELDPQHRGAHEYIGEAYLMTGNRIKAREHLKALERICHADCEEYRDLARALAAHERSTPDDRNDKRGTGSLSDGK